MTNRSDLTSEEKDYKSWPEVDAGEMTDKVEAVFKKRKRAVTAFLDGEPAEGLEGYSRQEVYRLVDRCLSVHPDGKLYGFRALLPRARTKAYERTKALDSHALDEKSGAAGMLGKLFREHPEIKRKVDDAALRRHPKGSQKPPRLSQTAIFDDVFLPACRAADLTIEEYPLNTLYQGKRSLSIYLHSLFDTNLKEAVAAEYGSAAARHLGTDSDSTIPAVTRPYQTVELDFHLLDAVFEILDPLGRSKYRNRIYLRPWLLAAIDVASRAVLAYLLILKPRPNHFDVLRLLKRVVTPWEPNEFTLENLSYAEGSGLPSGIVEECAWALPDEWRFDNDWAFLAHEVCNKITGVLGGIVNAGPYRTPNARPYIERLFGTLEEHGCHLLPSTTGSSPKDPRGSKHPEDAARRFRTDEDALRQITEKVITGYNATSHAGLGNRTPLEFLQIYTKEHLLRKLPDRTSLVHLNETVPVTVKGNLKESKRPYINYLYVRYTNHTLKNSPSLIGKPLVLKVDPDDLSQIPAYAPNPDNPNKLKSLGLLHPKSESWNTPHTIEERRAFYQSDKAGQGKGAMDTYEAARSLPNVKPSKRTIKPASRQQSQTRKRSSGKWHGKKTFTT